MKNDQDDPHEATVSHKPISKPEPGAASQLHNYNVMLTRLGDLFGDDDGSEPQPANTPGKPL